MTRKELSVYLGIPDRQAIKVIEKLRKQGNLIVNNGDVYFIAKRKLEAVGFLSEYCASWVSMSETAQIMISEYELLED